MPLSTQEFKWVPANYWGNLTNCGKVTCNGLVFHPGRVEILLTTSFYRNRDKLRQHDPVLAPRLHLFCTSVQRGPMTMFVTSDGEWWKLYSLQCAQVPTAQCNSIALFSKLKSHWLSMGTLREMSLDNFSFNTTMVENCTEKWLNTSVCVLWPCRVLGKGKVKPAY